MSEETSATERHSSTLSEESLEKLNEIVKQYLNEKTEELIHATIQSVGNDVLKTNYSQSSGENKQIGAVQGTTAVKIDSKDVLLRIVSQYLSQMAEELCRTSQPQRLSTIDSQTSCIQIDSKPIKESPIVSTQENEKLFTQLAVSYLSEILDGDLIRVAAEHQKDEKKSWSPKENVGSDQGISPSTEDEKLLSALTAQYLAEKTEEIIQSIKLLPTIKSPTMDVPIKIEEQNNALENSSQSRFENPKNEQVLLTVVRQYLSDQAEVLGKLVCQNLNSNTMPRSKETENENTCQDKALISFKDPEDSILKLVNQYLQEKETEFVETAINEILSKQTRNLSPQANEAITITSITKEISSKPQNDITKQTSHSAKSNTEDDDLQIVCDETSLIEKESKLQTELTDYNSPNNHNDERQNEEQEREGEKATNAADKNTLLHPKLELPEQEIRQGSSGTVLPEKDSDAGANKAEVSDDIIQNVKTDQVSQFLNLENGRNAQSTSEELKQECQFAEETIKTSDNQRIKNTQEGQNLDKDYETKDLDVQVKDGDRQHHDNNVEESKPSLNEEFESKSNKTSVLENIEQLKKSAPVDINSHLHNEYSFRPTVCSEQNANSNSVSDQNQFFEHSTITRQENTYQNGQTQDLIVNPKTEKRASASDLGQISNAKVEDSDPLQIQNETPKNSNQEYLMKSKSKFSFFRKS